MHAYLHVHSMLGRCFVLIHWENNLLETQYTQRSNSIRFHDNGLTVSRTQEFSDRLEFNTKLYL